MEKKRETLIDDGELNWRWNVVAHMKCVFFLYFLLWLIILLSAIPLKNHRYFVLDRSEWTMSFFFIKLSKSQLNLLLSSLFHFIPLTNHSFSFVFFARSAFFLYWELIFFNNIIKYFVQVLFDRQSFHV